MEQMQNQTPTENPSQTQEQMLQEILESTRKTKNYMKWQLIITVALVVLPLLATVSIIPFVLSAVNGIYDTSSLLQ